MRIWVLAAALFVAGLSAARADPLCDSVDNAILLRTRAKPIEGTGTSGIFKLIRTNRSNGMSSCLRALRTSGRRARRQRRGEGRRHHRAFVAESTANVGFADSQRGPRADNAIRRLLPSGERE
jgi:hypothetical protein